MYRRSRGSKPSEGTRCGGVHGLDADHSGRVNINQIREHNELHGACFGFRFVRMEIPCTYCRHSGGRTEHPSMRYTGTDAAFSHVPTTLPLLQLCDLERRRQHRQRRVEIGHEDIALEAHLVAVLLRDWHWPVAQLLVELQRRRVLLLDEQGDLEIPHPRAVAQPRAEAAAPRPAGGRAVDKEGARDDGPA